MLTTPSRGVDVHREDLLHLSPPLPSLVSVITSAMEDPSEQEGPEDNGCNINNVDDGRDNDNDDGRDEVDGEVAGPDEVDNDFLVFDTPSELASLQPDDAPHVDVGEISSAQSDEHVEHEDLSRIAVGLPDDTAHAHYSDLREVAVDTEPCSTEAHEEHTMVATDTVNVVVAVEDAMTVSGPESVMDSAASLSNSELPEAIVEAAHISVERAPPSSESDTREATEQLRAPVAIPANTRLAATATSSVCVMLLGVCCATLLTSSI